MNNCFNSLIISKNQISSITYEAINSQTPLIFSYLHFHTFNLFFESIKFQEEYIRKICFYADGIGINLAFRFLAKKRYSLFNASDINKEIFNYIRNNHFRVFIIGGNFSLSILESSQINIVGYSNGYEQLNNFKLLAHKITLLKPQAIIIGISQPIQEDLALMISGIKHNCPIICVGNFLEFYFGTKKRAPSFLINSGFEWVFRLLTEPKRLWKRYIFGIPLFVYRVLYLKYCK